MSSDDAGVGPDADRPLSAGESMALIEREQREVRRRLNVNVVLFYGPWGAAYLLGFGAVYLTYPSGLPARLPGAVGAVVTVVLFAVATVTSAVNGVRGGRGVRGPSRVVGSMYGWSWPLGFGALSLVNSRVIAFGGLSADAASLLWSGSALLLVGVLYLAGGALWQSPAMYALGVWMLVTGALSVLVGVPGNFLVLALGGGGGMLLTAVCFAVRPPRSPTRA